MTYFGLILKTIWSSESRWVFLTQVSLFRFECISFTICWQFKGSKFCTHQLRLRYVRVKLCMRFSANRQAPKSLMLNFCMWSSFRPLFTWYSDI